ncbi:CKLF-like MARVEL transmembrane domain-containing protein 8 [Bombina bombina]|uniref:CKLF-like MARVEL transmembrane domain-containing protein 8 n=1 Tax=Bombina bombina TaxID=8345 RepID=UPI00235A4DBC|nr:CKLF-like MARVEL transmembrane domain-containing protein 8 [Bombina bombina]
MDEERPRSNTVTTTISTQSDNFSSSASLSYDRNFLLTPPGALLLAETLFGLLVWALISATEYFRFPPLGWVIFVAGFYWVLSTSFLTMYITRAFARIPKVPWTLVALCFNGSAFVLYLTAAVIAATSIDKERHRHHDYDSWIASSVFAFLVTVCYAASTYFSFKSWRTQS